MIGAATWGLASVFLASAALCTLGAFISLTVPQGKPVATREPRSPLAELRDGLRYVRRRRDLTSWMRNERISLLRRPVWMETSKMARSRRPIQVFRSGAETSACISSSVRNSGG
jgi:hypothetical protein